MMLILMVKSLIEVSLEIVGKKYLKSGFEDLMRKEDWIGFKKNLVVGLG